MLILKKPRICYFSEGENFIFMIEGNSTPNLQTLNFENDKCSEFKICPSQYFRYTFHLRINVKYQLLTGMLYEVYRELKSIVHCFVRKFNLPRK